MNAVVNVTTSAEIADIADAIQAEHKAAQGHQRSAVEHAIRCGMLLLQAKATMKHGEWEGWLSVNVRFSARSAQGYMRLARLDPAKAQRVADLSLSQALKEVGQNYGRSQRRIERQVDREVAAAAPKPLVREPDQVIDVEVVSASTTNANPEIVDEIAAVIDAALPVTFVPVKRILIDTAIDADLRMLTRVGTAGVVTMLDVVPAVIAGLFQRVGPEDRGVLAALIKGQVDNELRILEEADV
jgi:hypothetical protein